MADIAISSLGDAVKQATLDILNQVQTHKLKGGDLIIQGLKMLEQGMDIAGELKEQLSTWTEILKTLVSILKPLFETVRDWLVSAYEHLVALFDWCKEKWHEFFG